MERPFARSLRSGDGLWVRTWRVAQRVVSFSDQLAPAPCTLNGLDTTCRAAAREPPQRIIPGAANKMKQLENGVQREAIGTARADVDFSSAPSRAARVMLSQLDFSPLCLLVIVLVNTTPRHTTTHPCSIIHNPRPWAPPLRRSRLSHYESSSHVSAGHPFPLLVLGLSKLVAILAFMRIQKRGCDRLAFPP
jgi:hypothetical protein